MDYTTAMQQAIAQARQAAARGEVPVGAVLLDGAGNLMAAAHNAVEATTDGTAHAELLVIRAACAARGEKYLPDCTLVVTLEPCAMCAQAAAWTRINTIVFGATDPKSGGLISGPNVLAHSHHKPQVHSGILADEAAQLLKDFFKAKR
jgi:tRNA(Arg) A34 adenosine deaminase TadA